MNTNAISIPIQTRAARVLLGLCLTLAQACIVGEADASAVPKLKTDDTPLPRDSRVNLTFAPVVKKVSSSVVNIYTAKTVRENPRLSPLFDDPFFRQFFGAPYGEENLPRERREHALGSGVIISEDGYILTNNHVVEGADEIKVVLADGKREFDAKVIGTDPQTDIGLIKVEGKNLPAITITDSDKLEVGDVILESNGKKVNDSRHLRLMAAQTPPGTRVTLKALRDGKEQTFTVKLAELPSEGMAKAGRPGPGRGRSVKGDPLDGVEVADLDLRIRRQFDIPNQVRGGALVANLDPNSPAAAAGLQPGEVILEINRKPVTNADQAIELSRQARRERLLLRVWSQQSGSHYLVVDASKRP